MEARTTCADMWKKRLDHQVLRERGMRQTKGRIPVFKVRDQAGGASNEKGRKTAAVKEWKDMTLAARQLHHVVMTVLDSNRKFIDKERRDILLRTGAVLPPCQCATPWEGRGTRKNQAPWSSLTSIALMLFKKGPFTILKVMWSISRLRCIARRPRDRWRGGSWGSTSLRRHHSRRLF